MSGAGLPTSDDSSPGAPSVASPSPAEAERGSGAGFNFQSWKHQFGSGLIDRRADEQLIDLFQVNPAGAQQVALPGESRAGQPLGIER